jgi:hypothetical protein
MALRSLGRRSGGIDCVRLPALIKMPCVPTWPYFFDPTRNISSSTSTLAMARKCIACRVPSVHNTQRPESDMSWFLSLSEGLE